MNLLHMRGNILYVIKRSDKYPINDGISLKTLNHPPFMPVIPVSIIPIHAVNIRSFSDGILIFSGCL